MVGGCLALLHHSQGPSCPRNELQEAAWQEMRLDLYPSVSQPSAQSVGMEQVVCRGGSVGGGKVGLHTINAFTASGSHMRSGR
jgi:hypothetical protein